MFSSSRSTDSLHCLRQPTAGTLALPPPGSASPRTLKCQDIPRSKPLLVLCSLPQWCHRSHSLEGLGDRKYPGSPALVGSGPLVRGPDPLPSCACPGSLQCGLGKSTHTKLCGPGAAQLHGLRKAAGRNPPASVPSCPLHINEMSQDAVRSRPHDITFELHPP